jgi:phosphoribosylaminoimidazole carboxylase
MALSSPPRRNANRIVRQMDKTVGILGGGQLGRMLTEAANRLNIRVVSLDRENAPAKQVNSVPSHVDGSFTDEEAIRRLAQRCNVLTVEIEHVNVDVLEDVAKDGNVEVHPSPRAIRVIQDKYMQKQHLARREIATAPSVALSESPSREEVERVAQSIGFPLMLKSRTNAYDGRGNFPIRSEDDIDEALKALEDRPLYAEQWAKFKMELAVMVVKTMEDAAGDWKGSTLAFDVVETVHEDSICKLVHAPAWNAPADALEGAKVLARRAVASFPGRGVFGVEMFLLEDGGLLINEIAPRVHNSGHHTIEACSVSQFEAHLRAILGLPICPEGLRLNMDAVMLNILGGARPDSHLEIAQRALSVPRASVHLYGKGSGRPGRKMGHVTVTANSILQALGKMGPLIAIADRIRAERQPEGSTSQAKVRQQEARVSTRSGLPSGTGRALVSVTMGSDSDLQVMLPAIKTLRDLDVPVECDITSAHRTPEEMVEFAKSASSRGIKVIIAGAGGAAHLPGMLASETHLPVIGVPVKGSSLDGLDSMLSILQMPVSALPVGLHQEYLTPSSPVSPWRRWPSTSRSTRRSWRRAYWPLQTSGSKTASWRSE